MEHLDDVLVPTTVLLPKKLKDRAKKVSQKYGDFSKLITTGLEKEVEILEKENFLEVKKAS